MGPWSVDGLVPGHWREVPRAEKRAERGRGRRMVRIEAERGRIGPLGARRSAEQLEPVAVPDLRHLEASAPGD